MNKNIRFYDRLVPHQSNKEGIAKYKKKCNDIHVGRYEEIS